MFKLNKISLAVVSVSIGALLSAHFLYATDTYNNKKTTTVEQTTTQTTTTAPRPIKKVVPVTTTTTKMTTLTTKEGELRKVLLLPRMNIPLALPYLMARKHNVVLEQHKGPRQALWRQVQQRQSWCQNQNNPRHNQYETHINGKS